MNHPTKEEWNSYITGQLSSLAKCEQYETHLYSCDRCLSVYMTCIEEQSASLPAIHDGAGFTNKVMAVIGKEKRVKKRRPFYQRTLFQYGAAAAVTIILMSSGMFQGITSYASHVESVTVSEKKTSLSDHLMDRAGNVLQSINPTTRRDLRE